MGIKNKIIITRVFVGSCVWFCRICRSCWWWWWWKSRWWFDDRRQVDYQKKLEGESRIFTGYITGLPEANWRWQQQQREICTVVTQSCRSLDAVLVSKFWWNREYKSQWNSWLEYKLYLNYFSEKNTFTTWRSIVTCCFKILFIYYCKK